MVRWCITSFELNNIAAIYHRQGLLALEMAPQDYDSVMEISEEYEYIELAKDYVNITWN